ncbi:MAG: hypothetical protein JWO82_3983 [Akkermansiaceae bacterium]|nr:hypothetical protein [Akkermansiaceae bacterium]
MISSPRKILILAAIAAISIPACKPKRTAAAEPSGASENSGLPTTTGVSDEELPKLKRMREILGTKLTKKEKDATPPEQPPAGVFDLIHYKGPLGSMAAYLSPDPKDGKKHPLIIWLVGGFGNDIGNISWEDNAPVENDQSASAYRKAGIAMMYPSLRGANGNPGYQECCCGEADDVLAAAAHAAKLPWVDPKRIYLGGHSTGGTLALLTAESADEGQFRAVIAFGPAPSAAAYGQERVPFDIENKNEIAVRSPYLFLPHLTSPTLVIEGYGGNADALALLRKLNHNPRVSFTEATGMSHFSVLHPANAVLAAKIANDTGATCNLSLSDAEIQAAAKK